MITVTAESILELVSKLRGIIPRRDTKVLIEEISNGIVITIPKEFKEKSILINFDK